MYQVKVASLAEFQGSQDKWNELVQSMRRPSVFCTWEWIYTWWEYFGKLYKLLIIFVYRDNVLIGILPLAERKMIIEGSFLPAQVLSLCGSNEVCPDFLDIICRKKDAPNVIEAVVEFLSREYTEWDVLHLSHLSEDSCLVEKLGTGDQANTNTYLVSVAPYVKLSDYESFDIYFQSLPLKSKHKKNLIRLKKRLKKEHAISLDTCTQESDVKIAVGEIFSLHKMRMRDKNIESSFTPQFNFHTSLALRFFKKNWLRIHFLRKEGRAIAGVYGFVFAGCYVYYQKGLDREWDRYSAGSVLLMETMNLAYSEQCAEFHFLRGEEAYKYKWTKNQHLLITINVHRNAIGQRLEKVSRFSRSLIKKVLKRK